MPNARKQLYEGMYILSATLSEDARQKALEKIQNLVTDRGGEIHKVFEQGRKKLAYEIGKKKEGYYYVLYFSLPTAHMPEVWREYHLNEDLVRFMTLAAEHTPEKIEFQPLLPA